VNGVRSFILTFHSSLIIFVNFKDLTPFSDYQFQRSLFLSTLNEIIESGGVAINDYNVVAFHENIDDPDDINNTFSAVFTQDGVVAKEGDTLGGTLLDGIDENGGVAINLIDDVAFHGDIVVPGEATPVKAVFTQYGLVAKVGDNLADGTTLTGITDAAGVAINPCGFEVAFHGRVGTTAVVLVGQAPLPPQ